MPCVDLPLTWWRGPWPLKPSTGTGQRQSPYEIMISVYITEQLNTHAEDNTITYDAIKLYEDIKIQEDIMI